MQNEGFLMQSASLKRIAGLLAVAVVLASAALAQSGRRLPNRGESPPPVTTVPPPGQAEPIEKPSSTKPDKPGVQILLARYNPDGFSSHYTNIVLDGCLSRLKDSYASITVGREMNRKEASDYAKNATDTHVLWIELDFDRSGSQRADQYESNMYINYVLYTPRTGKSKTSGRVFMSDYRRRVGVGGVGIPMPVPNSTAAAEYMLKECGREIGKRIIDSLNIGRPGH